VVGRWVRIDEEGGENGVEDKKESVKYYHVAQHDSERRGIGG
jgi:hypothetical protein